MRRVFTASTAAAYQGSRLWLVTMFRLIVFWLMAWSLCPGGVWASGAAPASSSLGRAPAVARPGMSLPVRTLAGQRQNLAGRPGWKVIYFWSATCPCVRACESFTFTPLAQRYKSRVSFFAVASDGYDLALSHGALSRQIQSRKLPFPVLLDEGHLAAQALGARVTPQAFLLDPHDRVVFAGVPDDSRRYQSRTGHWGVSKTYLAQAIAQALAGRPVTALRVKDQGCIIAW